MSRVEEGKVIVDKKKTYENSLVLIAKDED